MLIRLPILAMLSWFALTVPVEARWLVAETDNFRVYSEGSEKGLRSVSEALEAYWDLLGDLTGTKVSADKVRLDIYMVSGVGTMRELRDFPSNAAGAYIVGSTRVLALTLQSSGHMRADSTQYLFHEVAHHFMYQNGMAAYPAWYVEGFAEYVATARLTDASIVIGDANPGRFYALSDDYWLSAADMLTKRAREFNSAQIGKFYAQSWLAVHYLSRNPARLGNLQVYLANFQKGKDDEAAFIAAFGTDYSGFLKELKRYAGGQRMTMSVVKRTGAMSRAPVTIYPLPPSAEALLIPQAHLRIGVGKAYRDDRLSQIRRDAAKYPGDPFALAVLAEAELEIGDTKTGVGLLDSLLANDPQNAGLLTLRGLAALRAQDVVTGRRFLGRSYKLNPNDATTLFYYGRSFAGQEAVPSENTLNVLMRAADLAPQVSGINITVATVFMKARQFADAIRLLMPIASNPHGGQAADVARQMVDAAKAGKDVPVIVQTSEE